MNAELSVRVCHYFHHYRVYPLGLVEIETSFTFTLLNELTFWPFAKELYKNMGNRMNSQDSMQMNEGKKENRNTQGTKMTCWNTTFMRDSNFYDEKDREMTGKQV